MYGYRVLHAGVWLPPRAGETRGHQFHEGDFITGDDARALEADPQLIKRCTRVGIPDAPGTDPNAGKPTPQPEPPEPVK
jgi:hypothetical protein